MPSTCTVTGNIQLLTGSAATSGLVTFSLVNHTDQLPRVLGTTMVAQPTIPATPDGSGNFSLQLWGNDNISPAGTYYLVTAQSDASGNIAGSLGFNITGAAFNLNSATPINTAPVVAAPTGDTTYLRTDAGNTNLTGTTPFTFGNINNIRFASDFPGADAGAKIAAAIADLPSAGGTCDARGLEGAQAITSTLTIGSTTKPVRLLLGAATYTMTAGIIVHSGSSIIGIGRLNYTSAVTTLEGNAAITPITFYAANPVYATDIRLEDFTLRRKSGFAGTIPSLISATSPHRSIFKGLYLSGANTQEIYLKDFFNVAIRDCILIRDGSLAQQTGVGISVNGVSAPSTTFLAENNEINSYNHGVYVGNVFGVRLTNNNIFVGNNRAVKFLGGNGLTFKGNWVESGGIANTYAVEITTADVSRMEYGHNWLSGTPVSGGVISATGTQVFTPNLEEMILHGDIIFGTNQSDFNLGWLNTYKLTYGGIAALPTAGATNPTDFTITAAAADAGASHVGGEIILKTGAGVNNANGGVVLRTGSNVQAVGFRTLSELTTVAAAPTTDTTIQIPANAIVLGVSVRVTVVIPTAVTFTVTGAGTATTFNTAAVSTAATTTDVGTQNCPYKNNAAQAIRITPNLQPADATGRVRVTIHYYDITVPTT